MEVFDGKLNRVFQLQSRLKNLCSEIGGLRVADSDLSIYFDCNAELQKLQEQNEAALKLLVFDYKGAFGQEIYNRISAELDSKLALLQGQLDACEAIKTRFVSKQTDYESYCSYLSFYENSSTSFHEFKNQVTDYLRNNLQTDVPEIFAEAQQRIASVHFESHAASFEFGFNSKADRQRQAVIEHVAQKEDTINRVRADISNKVLNKIKATTGLPIIQDDKPSEDKLVIIEKIRNLIRETDDHTSRKRYEDSLQKLMKSKSLTDIYFLKELHDSILEAEKSRRLKLEIGEMLSKLNETTIHKEIEQERQRVIKLCVNLLRLTSVTPAEVEAARVRIEQMLRNSRDQFQQDEIRQKEHLFLKSQIVLSLENLGYEVMDDLEVIDFEKQDDLLLKVRNQENYLNLKFKEDGSMRYVFQIPEDPQHLSTDQKKLKLHETKITCDEFQSVLADLSKMGLRVSLRSEKPIEYDSLLTVSANKRSSVKDNAKRERRQQIRSRYLSTRG
jgi:hypothetical protein